MTNKTIKVSNINCGHCTGTIERELADLEGITSVKADVDTKTVAIEWNESSIAWTQITDLLDEIGYPAA